MARKWQITLKFIPDEHGQCWEDQRVLALGDTYADAIRSACAYMTPDETRRCYALKCEQLTDAPSKPTVST